MRNVDTEEVFCTGEGVSKTHTDIYCDATSCVGSDNVCLSVSPPCCVEGAGMRC